MSLIRGDARRLPLVDGCVQTCVTSPPYWGLRDYGTASWDGGDPGCDHRQEALGGTRNKGRDRAASGGRFHDSPVVETALSMPFRNVCGKCGATRIDSQIGLEATPEAYVAQLVAVFRDVRRVLKADGTLWLNLGDSYCANAPGVCSDPMSTSGLNGIAGSSYRADRTALRASNRAKNFPGLKPKDLVGIPWMVAFALQADGWYLRSDIIWSKAAPMPESVTDRPTKSHEYIFLLSKNARYFYDAEAIAEPAAYPNGMNGKSPVNSPYGQGFQAGRSNGATDGKRNKRSVWHIGPQPFTGWTKTSRQVRVSWDESDGDTTRIASRDCPVHGDLAVRSAKALCGGRGAVPVGHSGHTDNGLVPLQPVGFAPIDQHLFDCSGVDSSDFLDLPYEQPAKRRSNQNRKTGRAPVTTEPCMPSVQTDGDTGDISGLRGSSDSAEHMHANSSAEGCASGELAITDDETLSRIEGKCSCEYYRTVTEEMSHFATFPPALIEPCILAGSSPGDLVLDPFIGSGTVGQVCERFGRRWVGTDLTYQHLSKKRTRQRGLRFVDDVEGVAG